MPRIVVDQQVLSFTVRNLNSTPKRVRQAAAVATALAGTKVLAAIKQNVSIPAIGGNAKAHYSALAALDHPYARRHPTIQLSPQGGVPGFARRTLLVHTVTGDLLGAISGKFEPRSLTYSIETDLAKAPHLNYVIRGTQVMHGRDILWATATDPAMTKIIRKTVVFVMGKVFRTKAAIRFS